ncbi:protein kinase [Streptomyces chiangmaiensis]
MEYADGGTLADRIDGSPLPVAEALRLTALAARSAEALHDAGIVHRDIKPSNVLLRTAPDGSTRLLLADLGLAKSLAQASGLTMAAGSAGYAAPEQTEPGSGIDARADVYSLGALGYHLLTGTVPARPGRVQPPTGSAPACRPRSSGRSCGPWNPSASGAGRPPRPSRTRSTGLRAPPSRRPLSGRSAAGAAWSWPWPLWSSRVSPQPPPPCCCGSSRRRG